LIVMLTDDSQGEALDSLRQSFQQTLERGIAEAKDDTDRQAFQAIASAYASFLQQVDASRHQRLSLLDDNPLSQAFNQVRSLMTEMQRAAYEQIRDTELRSRDRASLLAGLLGLTAIAVLLIGFITAHSFARRFGEPIERLSAAADQIGRGDFNISLPTPPIAELSSLSRRFGLMAQAL
ncbi:HAMP domain-containing protein, partial [Leclercia adecarboxylata]|uniref:KinB sensor domain-containing domain n=1 Tax=Leclercia adecarboxylata TaxID=83655 RepID=UPI00234DF0B3